MKRFFILLMTALLLLAPLTALAYYDAQTGMFLTDCELPAVYGTLNRRMATRTGPATEYPEPGTFYGEGARVRIVSITYDRNNVPWVQVDMQNGAQRMRVYTGLKRIDGVCVSDIPHEMNYGVDMQLLCTAEPLMGPGTQYASCGYYLMEGSCLTLIDEENGFAMLDFYDRSTDTMNRVWLPCELLSVY